ncbi:MAG TPA: AraC family transcriptional regulator [Noviherbaspirillum sp.]|nr:AraC family transcriptional regulator [Noviherbaspirillum sp.]
MSHPDYGLRMNRVLDYIDHNLDQTLDLDTLADIANFSRFHFHRVFSGWAHETFGDYLRRRRLEVGARLLLGDPAVPVLNVALSVGFGSSEAFSRAFKTHFGLTPSTWRMEGRKSRCTQNSNMDQLQSNPDQATPSPAIQNGSSHTSSQEFGLEIIVIDVPPMKVAYLRHIGPYGPSISAFWKDVVYPWMAVNALLGRERYGVVHDDPGITPPDKCRYDACIEVSTDFDTRRRFSTTTLPGGRYATVKFTDHPVRIAAAWNAILHDWLPASGYQVDARPCFEFYAASFVQDLETKGFCSTVCVPVKPV